MSHSEHSQLQYLISDTYKDLHGVRPSPRRDWSVFTVAELREWYADMHHRIDASIEREQREQSAHEAAVREAMTPSPAFTLAELL